MPVVGGLDIHRKRLTFDYPGTMTGQVSRLAGPVRRAQRRGVRDGGVHRVAVRG